MVNSCAAYGCANHNKMENKPGFFRFPNNNPELRRKWIQACKRINKDGSPWNPKGPNVYLCGKHFITGKEDLIHLSADKKGRICETRLFISIHLYEVSIILPHFLFIR